VAGALCRPGADPYIYTPVKLKSELKRLTEAVRDAEASAAIRATGSLAGALTGSGAACGEVQLPTVQARQHLEARQARLQGVHGRPVAGGGQ
jgi:hypothetical protein